MSDVIVSFVLENLKQLLLYELKLPGQVKDQVRSLEVDLKFIKEFLRRSGGRHNQDSKVKELVDQIRDVAHEAEDAIDNFVVDIMKQKRRNIFGKIWNQGGQAFKLQGAATNIESIKKTITEIYENKERYGIDVEETRVDTDSEASSIHQRRRKVEENDVVGLVDEAEELVKRLKEGNSARETISIIGMGGLGKTTLAKKIYNDIFVNSNSNSTPADHFDFGAWVDVSQQYTVKQVLLGILGSAGPITEETNQKDVRELKEELRNCLKDKRYLIVMDDVWDTQLWDELSEFFPDDKKGSRILLTSRMKEVALYARSNPPHLLRFRNPEESWQLFSRKVFQGQNCPNDLKQRGEDIAKNCKGLPLAIVVLAGMLAGKERSDNKWKQVAESVRSYFRYDLKEPLEILALSYDSLPDHLKPCFLYLGVYPKGFEISARQLIQLWIAEGFIPLQSGDDAKPEIMGQRYLDELISRSLVQVASKSTDGGVKTCGIHDLLHDLCIYECAREKFLEVHENVKSKTSTKPRKISVQCNISEYLSSCSCDFFGTRTLLCFDEAESNIQRMHKFFAEGFRLVRVMGLRSNITGLDPKELEKRVLLRYLRLRRTSLDKIAPAICKLWKLETLDVRDCSLSRLPEEIWNMQQLRHLYMSGSVTIPKKDKGKPLVNLQTLSTIRPDKDSRRIIESDKFPYLTKLGICGDRADSTKDFLACLPHLKYLQTLKIKKPAKLYGDPSSYPLTLTKITLEDTSLLSDDIQLLGKLPKLQILKLLENSIEGQQLKCSADSFSQLQTFHMVKLNISQWTLVAGAMQSLQHVVVNECAQLRNLPQELWKITTLRQLKVVWPHSNLRSILVERQDNAEIKVVLDPPTG